MRLQALVLIASVMAGASDAVFAAEPAPHAHPVPAVNTASTIRLGGELRGREIGKDDVARLPRQQVTATAHGVSASHEGVNLIDLLAESGAPTGKALRGKALSMVVRIRAADGYAVVYSLAELDAGFRGNRVLLVDRSDGVALDGKDGAFRLVAPDEARPGRWVRQVVAIDLVSVP